MVKAGGELVGSELTAPTDCLLLDDRRYSPLPATPWEALEEVPPSTTQI